MSLRLIYQEIDVDLSGGTVTINTASDPINYIIVGSGTMLANFSIVPSTNPSDATEIVFNYQGSLDITTNSTTFSIFGQTLTASQLLKTQYIKCIYYNSAWNVQVISDFDESNIIEQFHLSANSVVASKIQNNTITNAKMAAGTASSLKFCNSSGTVGDLALANNEIAIGNGSTIVAANKSTLLSSLNYFVTVPVSFESGEQGNNAIYIPINCTIDVMKVCITKQIAGTDDALIELYLNNNTVHPTPDLTITAGTTINTVLTSSISGSNITGGTLLYVKGTKTTAGGKCLVTLSLLKT